MKRYYLTAIMIIACLSLSYSQVETHYLNNGEATKLINKPIRSKVCPLYIKNFRCLFNFYWYGS